MLMQQQTEVQQESDQQQEQTLHPIKIHEPSQYCPCTKTQGLIFISISLFLLLSWHILNFSPSTHIIIISWDKQANEQPANLQNIINQSYQNWQIFYFRSTKSQKYEQQDNINIIKSSGSKVQDIYKVITDHSESQSIIFLLNENEILMSPDELNKIVYVFDNKSVYSGFMDFNLKGQIVEATTQLFDLRRDIEVPIYSKSLPQKFYNASSKILNHMRVFRSSFFQAIMYIDLMNTREQFYKTQLSFLLPLLEMQGQFNNIFHFDWPVFQSHILHNLQQPQQILQIGLKTKYSCENVQNFELLSTKEINCLRRKKLTQLNQKIIPSKIHRIYIGSSFQQSQRTHIKDHAIFKQFEQIIWTKQNITVENFPKTFSFVAKILNDQSKINQIKNLIVWELLYIQGGIYIDYHYELLRIPQNIEYYPFSCILDSTLNSQAINIIMASQPNNQFLKRLLNSPFLTGQTYENLQFFSTQYILSKMKPEQFYIDFKIYPAWKFAVKTYNPIDKRRSQFLCTTEICQTLGWNYGFIYENSENKNRKQNSQEQISKDKQDQDNSITTQFDKKQFCIISVKQSTIDNFISSFQLINNQTFKNWKSYFYVSSKENKYNREKLLRENQAENIIVIMSSGNQGRDIYDAIINQCSYYSITVLLNQGETLFNQETLSTFIKYFDDGKTYLIASPLYLKENLILPTTKLWKFRRDYFFKGNKGQLEHQKYLSMNMMQTIRIFRSEMYRRIQYFDLMYENQTFYQQKVSFLFPLIEFRCKNHCKLYNDQKKFFLPQSFQILDKKNPLYKTQFQESIKNEVEFLQIGAKMMYEPLQQLLNFAEQKHPHGNPPSHNPLMWSTKLNILQRKISDFQKIPRIVHQIWVGKQLPAFKLKFMKRVRTILQADGFQYKLWGNDNITVQNFPYTYKYIQKLFEIDKTSTYTRLAMIVDLMKVQIVYHQGGFYIDTNYQLFKSLTSLLKYSFVGMMELPPFLGQYLATSFFGAQKNTKFLRRLFQPTILESLNLYEGPKSNLETGPAFLARGFYPQDYYYQIKVMPSQKIYPYIYWGRDIRFTQSKCQFPIYMSIPPNLKGKYDQVIETIQYKILHPCRLYPNAYGMDHWNLGGSWKAPKT